MSSEISEHVSITITEDSVGVARAGFGTQLILSCNASFAERVRYYSDLPELVTDGFVTTSPEYRAARAAFAQRPKPETVGIGRCTGKPTQRYQINVSAVTTGATYKINAKGHGVTDTTVTYEPPADLTFVGTNAGDLATAVAHGMSTGDGPYRVSAVTSLPTGLAVDTDYWMIKLTADTFQFATSKANALALTAIVLTADGVGTQTLRRSQNDVICAQLVQGLNAVTGKNFTAAQTPGAAETDYVVVTGNAAGDWFSLEVTNVALMKIAQTHAEPGTALATDLDAIQLEDGDWYGVTYLYNSDACVKAVASWVESADAPKIYIADISDSETVTLAAVNSGDSDLANDLKLLTYARTATAYHPSPADMLGSAWFGRVLPIDPGSETWKFKRLRGLNPVSTTTAHRTKLRNKNCNTFTRIAGVNITWEGKTVDGDYIDVTRGIDWLEDDMQKSVYEALINNDKIPYSNAGIQIIANEIEGSLDRGVQRGILREGTVSMTVPKVEDIDDADRDDRLLPDMKWDAELEGAVHKVDINGTVSV